jgi:hypothetical protein
MIGGERGVGSTPGRLRTRAPRTETPIYQGKRDPYPLGVLPNPEGNGRRSALNRERRTIRARAPMMSLAYAPSLSTSPIRRAIGSLTVARSSFIGYRVDASLARSPSA